MASKLGSGEVGGIGTKKADVAEQLGTGFVNRLMLVQLQSSALEYVSIV